MKRKISCMLIILMMLMSTIASFAAVNFSDVPSTHWAKDYIAKMADKKIINGYFDDKTLKVSFKPNNPVSYVEAMTMLYNTLKAANKLKDTTGLVAKYKTTLAKNKIPSWAYEPIAYGLEYGILHPDEIKVFVKNGKQAYAKKVDVAVFIGKALDMKDQLDPLPVLDFVDAELIISAALPYVDLLEKKGIVSGDNERKFNPNSIINRAVMATMCSKTYDLLIKEPIVPVVSKYLEGTIEYVSKDAKMIIVKDTKGDKKAYTLKNTSIKKDEKSITISDLSVRDSVKLTFKSNGELTEIEVKNSKTPSEDISIPSEKKRIIDYVDEDTKMIVVKDDKGNIEVYKLKGVSIKINGRSKHVDDLNKGDEIKLVFDKKGELDKVLVDNTVTSMEGRVVSLKEIEDDVYILTVRDKENLIIKKELRINEDTKIEYDDDEVKPNKLMEGMEVYIKHIGDRAIEIEIYEKERTYNGILESSVLFRDGLILKVRMNDGEVKEFEIDEDADVERDGSNAYLDELEKGDIVTFKMKYGKVTDIEAIARTDRKSKVEGVIKQITIGDPSTITIVNDDDKETVTYYISKGVEVRIDGDDDDDKGDKYTLKDLDIHYEVELRIDNGKVYRIDADKISSKDMITGEIVRVYDDYDQLRVKYFDKYDKDYKTISVLITDDTKIISTEGKEIRLRNLDEDDEVLIDGHFEDDMFVANRIIQIK
ncbi:S-layer homology domain-containing protein [Crassaminicella thermophila]|uniref:S-layer homology domain-containing protein n=1 Tax=Crassaminicella thermophila TaxID=2599308 RepID=A0A5C0SJ45_CRATE|nr:S-layer homology domain-containing protein [Crassaminicella thermophila]QEK13248.1 S-layer homology domain-containing protein [Crassaminicella thermophila]